MKKCKNCGKEFTPRQITQLFCTTYKDGKGNCTLKYRMATDKKRYNNDHRDSASLDELSSLSAKLFKE